MQVDARKPLAVRGVAADGAHDHGRPACLQAYHVSRFECLLDHRRAILRAGELAARRVPPPGPVGGSRQESHETATMHTKVVRT